MAETAPPLISVVLAVHNGERFLRQALDSLFGQTFPDFELIVVDDASTDGTAAILASYDDPRLIRLRHRANLGQTPALNRGLVVARGEFIARHDADDYSHPDRFRQQVAFLTAHPATGLLGTSYHYIDQHGQLLETVTPPLTNAELQSRLLKGNIFCHGSVMMRRCFLEQVGRYNEGFPVTQDYDLWLRLAEVCELANLPEPLYWFRFEGTTVTRRKRDLQLSYRRLARLRAAQRRAGEAEAPLLTPEAVPERYPPEPERRLGDARWAAYLFYAAGELSQAAAALQKARAIELQTEAAVVSWQDWALGRARVLAHLRGDVTAGSRFIAWVYTTLAQPPNGTTPRHTLGRFFADQAFLAHQAGARVQVRQHAWQALRYSPRWLGNRGLWAIFWKSFFKSRTME